MFGLIFIFLDIFKKKDLIDLDRKKLYLKIFVIVSIFTIHLISNTFYDGVSFEITSFVIAIGIIFLFLFIEYYYNFIRNNLDKIIYIFLIILIASTFSGVVATTEWEKQNLGHCVFLYKFQIVIFKENSHLAMMLPLAIGYLFLTSNKTKYKYFFSILFSIFLFCKIYDIKCESFYTDFFNIYLRKKTIKIFGTKYINYFYISFSKKFS